MKEFDEIEAIGYIKNAVPELQSCSDDDILLIIDTIFEYDETIGEDAEDEQLTPEAIGAYVAKQLKHDSEFNIPSELILPAVRAEMGYEGTLWDED